ncbi:MAG: TRAP transporter large permease subunit, partial [Deltaproteobacteria bacterium]|nr:TRAP transporter large permease subunit [Deltaproteobacteria bacterium]
MEGHAPWRAAGILLAGVALCLYTVLEVLYLFLPPLAELAVFLTLSFIIAFLRFPMSRSPRLAWIDVAALLAAVVTGTYIVVEHDALMVRIGIPTPADVAMGIAATLLVLEAARRAVGWIVPALATVALAYAAFGSHLPAAWGGHSGFSLQRIVTDIYLTEQGIFGPALGIMFRLVVLFVLLGSLLNVTGGTGFLIDLSQALFGRFAGGPGKVAVVSSGLFGTISGSAVANVMVDGWITIPMMKRVGFRPHVAAAVEAAASTGGQLM